MKIIYIHPSSLQTRDSQVVLPIGMISLGNIIEKLNHQFKVIDIPLETKLDKNFDINKKIMEYCPDIVMIDLHWAIYSYSTITLSQQVKKLNKDIKIIVGGITASIFKKEILENFNSIDYLIKGDSEETIKLLLNYLEKKDIKLEEIPNLIYRKDNEICENETTFVQNNINELNYYNYDFIDNYKELLKKQADYLGFKYHNTFAWVPIARGCNYNCSYCGGNCKMFKKHFGYKKIYFNTPKSICEIMQKMYDKYNVSAFGVTHDFGLYGKNYYGEIFSEMKKLSFKPCIVNYLFQLPSMDFFKKYLKVIDLNDSILGLSMVSGDDKTRRQNGKLYTNKQIFKTLKLFKNTNVKIDLYLNDNNINGVKTFNKTIKFIKKLYRNFGKTKLNFNIAYAIEILQPESELSYGANGQKATFNSFMDYYNRYSPKFLEELPIKKNLEDVVGLSPYDKDCTKRSRIANDLINKLKKKYNRC